MSKDNTSTQGDEFSNPFSCTEDKELFVHAPMGIFTSTPEGRFLAVNPAMAAMFGYDSAHEMIESITDISEQLYVDSADRDEFIRLMEEKRKAVDHECRLLRRDGSIFWISGNFRALQDQEGRVVAFQGFIT